MTRPLVLLDVDGVLNALAASEAWTEWRTGRAVAGGGSYVIRWAPEVVERVLSWGDHAEVRWLTTWGHDANSSLRHLLEMPELPVAGTWDDPDAGAPVASGPTHADVAPAAPDPLTGRWWKFDVVRRLVRAEPSRPVVWVDDDLVRKPEVAAWMADEATALLVVPDPRTGLVDADLVAVETFLRDHS
jgi:hypothetical protein